MYGENCFFSPFQQDKAYREALWDSDGVTKASELTDLGSFVFTAPFSRTVDVPTVDVPRRSDCGPCRNERVCHSQK